MSYLYPIVPEKVVGKKLYPLNVVNYCGLKPTAYRS